MRSLPKRKEHKRSVYTPRLRDDAQLLQRVLKAAVKLPEHKGAKVKNYTFFLNGQGYAPNNLEQLPKPIRPSTLATPRSEEALAFFSRHSMLSNHHPSPFKFQGIQFQNMEQYLAYRRAVISDKKDMVDKALNADNPADAKAILNSLKKDHVEEWQEKRAEIALLGLRQKFKQNKKLKDFLCGTDGLRLAEASRNAAWGVEMTLTDPKVLDPAAWPNNGNILGKALEKIRKELLAPKKAPRK